MLKLARIHRVPMIIIAIILTTGLIAIGERHTLLQDEDSCRPPNLNTSNWSTDFCQSVVDFTEIIVGNPTKNGIPSVTDPNLESVEDASTWLSERSSLKVKPAPIPWRY